MKRPLGTLLLLLLLSFLVFAGAASAHRPAVKAEKNAMIYEASGRYYHDLKVAEPRSAPLKCFKADISTKQPGSTWGAWTFANTSYVLHHQAECRAGDGIVFEHKIDGTWYVVWEDSDGYPPTHNETIDGYAYQGVPRSVAKDLAAGLY
jgi:hypothetical protein